ncbi:MAG: hypothetical protein RR777_02665 [Christensenellaceae bacterium]
MAIPHEKQQNGRKDGYSFPAVSFDSDGFCGKDVRWLGLQCGG